LVASLAGSFHYKPDSFRWAILPGFRSSGLRVDRPTGDPGDRFGQVLVELEEITR
jgi:hypothetical protein